MNFRKILSLFLAITFCVTIFSSCGEADKNVPSITSEKSNQKEEKTIILFGGNEDEGFYQIIKKGAVEAAEKYGYTLEYVGVDESTVNVVNTHITGIRKAINQGATGIVIVPAGEGYSEIYSRLYNEKIPVVQIGYLSEEDFELLESNKKNPIISTIVTDYQYAGAVCAEMLFEKIKEDIKNSSTPFVVGVIKRDDSLSDEVKVEGFVEKFTELADADQLLRGKYKIEIKDESQYEKSFDSLMQDGANTVFITDSDIADKISDVVMAEKDKYKDVVFCGFDSGAKQLKWLSDDNPVQFLGGVAQDAFNLGYNAVEQGVFAIEGKDIKEEIKVKTKWYDKENLDKMKQDDIVFEK